MATEIVPKMVVLILNWNGWKDTVECIASVQRSDYGNFHIVVIDNHSEDDSAAQIKANYPDIDLLETSENLGYAGGNNVGFEYAARLNADYVFVLNNDTIIDPGCLKMLVEAGESHADAGIIGCFVFAYDPPQPFLYAGLHTPDRLNVPEMGNYHLDDVRGALEDGNIVPVDAAHGCAFAIKRAALADVKGFDAAFFAIHEEVDLSMRAREAGWKVIAAPQARVYHKVGASFGKQSANRVYYDVRNRARYFANRARGEKTHLLPAFWARFVVSGAGRVIKSLLRGEKNVANAVLQGTYDGIRGIGGKRRNKG